MLGRRDSGDFGQSRGEDETGHPARPGPLCKSVDSSGSAITLAQSTGYPVCNLVFRPGDSTTAELHWFGKPPLGHPAVDGRTAESDAVLHLRQADEPGEPAGFGLSTVDLVTHDDLPGR